MKDIGFKLCIILFSIAFILNAVNFVMNLNSSDSYAPMSRFSTS